MGDVEEQLAACRERGAAWFTEIGNLLDVLLAPIAPEAETPLQTMGVTALHAMTDWVVSLAQKRRFTFPRRAEIIRSYLGSPAYAAARLEAFAKHPNIARVFKAMCSLKEQLLELASRHSVTVLPKEFLEALSRAIIFYRDRVRIDRESRVGKLSFVRTSEVMKDYEL